MCHGEDSNTRSECDGALIRAKAEPRNVEDSMDNERVHHTPDTQAVPHRLVVGIAADEEVVVRAWW